MAKKTQSARGQQAQTEQPDQAESGNFPPDSKAGSAHARAEPSGPEWTFARPSEDSSFKQMCQELGRTA